MISVRQVKGKREIDLMVEGEQMSRLRYSALVLDPDPIYLPEGFALPLLTAGAPFDGLARRWFVEHATEAGWDQDRIDTSCFLARLYRLVCLKRRVLTSHDILGHGYGWGKAAIAEVSGDMNGTGWERVIALYGQDDETTREALPTNQELQRLHDEVLIWRSPWLKPLNEPPEDELDDKDTTLVEHLQDWDGRVRVDMEYDFLEAEALRPEDLDELDDATVTEKRLRFEAEYTSKLKQHLQDVKRGRIAGDIGTPERLARVLWQGRVEFLWRWDRAAEAVHRALLACEQVSREEADLFAMLHINFWPMSNTVVRVDEVIREFLLFGEKGEWSALRAAIAAFVFDRDSARDHLRLRFSAYLQALRTYLEMQRAEDREAKTEVSTVTPPSRCLPAKGRGASSWPRCAPM
ncbi:MAG: hypothetical protein R6V07_02730, partial [Armatimonadota bacterium]